MKNNNANASTAEQADLAMKRVLQAEREAEQAVLRCEQEAGEIHEAAQHRAQHIAARTNERISRLQGRYDQKLNHEIKTIEQAGQVLEQALANGRLDESRLASIIEALAEELTMPAQAADGADP